MAKAAKLNIPAKTMTPAIEGGAIEKAVKDAGGSTTKMYSVPIEKIETIPGFNVRVDSEDYIAHRDDLAASIAANGFNQTKPLTGYVGKSEDGSNVIFITDGHTRLDAVKTFNDDLDTKKADQITSLPIVIRKDQPSMTDMTVALHTDNNGRRLTPYELGTVVLRLLSEEGADKEQLARRLAVTPRYLDDVILLAEAPAKIRGHVLRGNVSSTMAIQELRRDPAKAVERITAAVEKAQSTGKKRATAQDVGPKLVRNAKTIAVAAGTNMKELVKLVAAEVRSQIPVEGDGDDRATVRVGEIKLTIGVGAEPAAPKKATPKKAAPKKAAPKKADAAKAKPAAKKADAAKAKPAAKKATPKKAKPAAKKAPPTDEPQDDLGIAGAEPLTDEDLDMPLPPTTKGDAGSDDIGI